MAGKDPFPGVDWFENAWKNSTQFFEKTAAMDKFGDANRDMIDRMQHMAEETFSFMQKRMQADFEVAKRFADCRSPEDFAEVQARFLREMWEDYSGQAMSVGETVRDAAGAAWRDAAEVSGAVTPGDKKKK
ncbi:MAG: phasin family protein [Hyphomicrobiales bacterium]|nr:phasin family protein [Hyphomicrobiales bacterium]